MNFSISEYWAQGDAISHMVAYLLLAMSLASWFTILSKAWTCWRIRRSARVLDAFWKAPTMDDAIAMASGADSENIYAPLAIKALHAADPVNQAGSLSAATSVADLITRSLRQEMNRIVVRLEMGLTLLASIGSTAPFVGLLGTVWGIYHALTEVSASGIVQIDKVAGPVGEALIMTALGLMVAIPAVLSYNALNRVNRITMAELDAFAYDLHAHMIKVHGDAGPQARQ
ncbi:MotA/TolQ/ExbB proton channel family protein [Undibacterium sp.]|jgi:biopolymer transport protein ExbB|uniref:MotA/TolQ/ExbB proton channel family protein n=1 Tax=Undibacterium sp. TaxID=1914977 RepID=UPI002B610CD8|nr:MotA/TolQ/ExbB proton channel family protein [Undibacterium sp.]HTD04582.1 MotA/TolQ/ExbB proton channel family protein [Undibacterium sp.]